MCGRELCANGADEVDIAFLRERREGERLRAAGV